MNSTNSTRDNRGCTCLLANCHRHFHFSVQTLTCFLRDKIFREGVLDENDLFRHVNTEKWNNK